MQTKARQSWGIGTPESHTAIMRNAALADLAPLARSYDWSAHPEPVLGWAMAQKCIDLGTAVTVFFDVGLERFNYPSKRAVPRCYVPGVRLLDNICLRINCGFYLPHAAHPHPEHNVRSSPQGTPLHARLRALLAPGAAGRMHAASCRPGKQG